MAIEELGPALDPDTLVQLSVPEPVVEPGRVQGEVLDMNRFGNVELNIRPEHLAAAGLEGLEQLAIEAASGSARARRGTTYADVDPDEYGVFVDHRGWLTVIRGNPGNAAAGLGVQVGDLIWITPLPSADDDRAQEREPETEGDEQLVEGRFPL